MNLVTSLQMLVIICRKDCQYLRKSCRSRNSADAEFIYKVGFGAAKIEPSKLCYKGRSPSIYTSWIPRSQPSPLFRIEARFNQLNELMADPASVSVLVSLGIDVPFLQDLQVMAQLRD